MLMNTRISIAQKRGRLDAYRVELEEKFHPSTFKYVKVGSFFDSIFDFLKPFEKKDKNISLYLEVDDDIADEKTIENDLAVVSSDFVEAIKKYDTGQKISRWK